MGNNRINDRCVVLINVAHGYSSERLELELWTRGRHRPTTSNRNFSRILQSLCPFATLFRIEDQDNLASSNGKCKPYVGTNFGPKAFLRAHAQSDARSPGAA
jgi:hypothetical protein